MSNLLLFFNGMSAKERCNLAYVIVGFMLLMTIYFWTNGRKIKEKNA